MDLINGQDTIQPNLHTKLMINSNTVICSSPESNLRKCILSNRTATKMKVAIPKQNLSLSLILIAFINILPPNMQQLTWIMTGGASLPSPLHDIIYTDIFATCTYCIPLVLPLLLFFNKVHPLCTSFQKYCPEKTPLIKLIIDFLPKGKTVRWYA